MSSKLTFAKSVHSWVCLLHVFLFRPQVPEQHVNLGAQLGLLRHSFTLRLKKMQPGVWPLGRGDREGSVDISETGNFKKLVWILVPA